jgi:dCTP deaminase
MIRKDLNKLFEEGKIRKDSLLITLGDRYQALKKNVLIDPFDKDSINQAYEPIVDMWESKILDSFEFVLISSKEKIQISNNSYGLISTLSHVARMGLMSQPSSFFIDPGFSGHITIELSNLSPSMVKIYKGMPIAKIILFKCDDLFEEQENSKDKIFFYGKDSDLMSKYFEEFNI